MVRKIDKKRMIPASTLRTYGILVTWGIMISSMLEVSTEPPWGSELMGRTGGEFEAVGEVVKREFQENRTSCGKLRQRMVSLSS